MSKVCDLSGKKVQFGNNVSKANNKTRRKFNPNMQSATFKSDLLNKNIRFNVATSSIRTVTKFGGIDEFLIRTKSKKLSLKAKRIRKIAINVDFTNKDYGYYDLLNKKLLDFTFNNIKNGRNHTY